MKTEEESTTFSPDNRKGILTPLLHLSSHKRAIIMQTLMSKGAEKIVSYHFEFQLASIIFEKYRASEGY